MPFRYLRMPLRYLRREQSGMCIKIYATVTVCMSHKLESLSWGPLGVLGLSQFSVLKF